MNRNIFIEALVLLLFSSSTLASFDFSLSNPLPFNRVSYSEELTSSQDSDGDGILEIVENNTPLSNSLVYGSIGVNVDSDILPHVGNDSTISEVSSKVTMSVDGVETLGSPRLKFEYTNREKTSFRNFIDVRGYISTLKYLLSIQGKEIYNKRIEVEIFVNHQWNIYDVYPHWGGEENLENNTIVLNFEILKPEDNSLSFSADSMTITQADVVNPDINKDKIVEIAENNIGTMKSVINVKNLPTDSSGDVQIILEMEGLGELGTLLVPIESFKSNNDSYEVSFDFNIPVDTVDNFKLKELKITANYNNDAFEIYKKNIMLTQQPALIFREMEAFSFKNFKIGDTGFIPGFDHVALGMYDENKVYEANIYILGKFEDPFAGGEVDIPISQGVQKSHTISSFIKNKEAEASYETDHFRVDGIDLKLANDMRGFIQNELGSAFNYPDVSIFSKSLLPENQKGKGEPKQYTCIGLIERAAEEAKHNDGQGFVPDILETVTLSNNRIGILSPALLNAVLNGSIEGVDKPSEWYKIKGVLKGMIDPVDFMITDPLGRRLGYDEDRGFLNEIPGAFFSGNGEVEQFFIINPLEGEYRFEFTGLGDVAKVGIEGFLNGIRSNIEIDEFLSLGVRMETIVNVGLSIDTDQTFKELIEDIPLEYLGNKWLRRNRTLNERLAKAKMRVLYKAATQLDKKVQMDTLTNKDRKKLSLYAKKLLFFVKISVSDSYDNKSFIIDEIHEVINFAKN